MLAKPLCALMYMKRSGIVDTAHSWSMKPAWPVMLPMMLTEIGTTAMSGVLLHTRC